MISRSWEAEVVKRFFRRLLARQPRTPEGVPSQCPVCAAVICLEPTGSLGEATCPYCQRRLWFVQVFPHGLYYPDEEVSLVKRQKIAVVLTKWAAKTRQGTLAVDDLDSMELVEIVMEMEQILGVSLTEEAVREMKSLADLIDYFVRECPD
jgi:acyl carrier protein